jgi:hypothetical protein
LKEGRGTLKGGARDGFLTEKENSPESDKGTRRRGDQDPPNRFSSNLLGVKKTIKPC